MLEIAKDDELGRKLQDANLITKKRAPKKNKIWHKKRYMCMLIGVAYLSLN